MMLGDPHPDTTFPSSDPEWATPTMLALALALALASRRYSVLGRTVCSAERASRDPGQDGLEGCMAPFHFA